MYWTNLMNAMDLAVGATTWAMSLVSAGALFDVIWMFLLGSLVMGLLAASSTVIQRQRSHWLRNRLEQSPRLVGATNMVMSATNATVRPAARALEYAA
jgi:sensor c-di-GMP phosphodiesterase-like protein